MPNLTLPIVLTAALGVAVSACVGGSAELPRAELRVAFLQDLSVEDHVDLVSPSFLAIEEAFAQAALELDHPIEVVGIDTEGNPAAALAAAREVADDPSYVAVVAGPFWEMTADAASVLADAGLPILSLSQVSEQPPTGTWRGLVGDDAAMVSRLSSLANGAAGEVCVAGDGTPRADSLAVAIVGSTPGAREGVAPSCDTLMWTGGPEGAEEARSLLAPTARLIVADASKSAVLLEAALPDGDGIVAVCPCADVSTSTRQRAMAFVNAYQSATGLPPGIYAAEGWDAARIFLEAARQGAGDRTAFAAALEGLSELDGAARPYRFDASGALLAPPELTTTTRSAGRRWLVVP